MPEHLEMDTSRHTTREQAPSLELRRECLAALDRAATRLDAAYRFHMELVSRARAEDVALLGQVLHTIR